MAYIEAAVVVYLRCIYSISDIKVILMSFNPQIVVIEIGRELATMAMLLVTSWLSGRNHQARLGYMFFAFGLWDIFYYY